MIDEISLSILYALYESCGGLSDCQINSIINKCNCDLSTEPYINNLIHKGLIQKANIDIDPGFAHKYIISPNGEAVVQEKREDIEKEKEAMNDARKRELHWRITTGISIAALVLSAFAMTLTMLHL
jgi:hypothetical protein